MTESETKALKELHFPQERSLGALYQIYRTGTMSGWWENKLGEAQGTVQLVKEANLHLLVSADADLRDFNYLPADALQSIDFRMVDIDNQSLECISHLTGLRYLSLPERKIGDDGMYSLRNLRFLHTLDLGGTEVSDYGLSKLRHLTELRKLYVDSTAVSGPGAAELNQFLPNCHIVVHSGRMLNFPFEVSPGKLLVAQADPGGQRTWSEVGEALGTVQVSRRAFVRLEVLDREAFQKCERLKPDDIQSLDYLFDEISDLDFDVINRLSGLRELRLGGLEIEKYTLRELANLQRLRTLQLTSCNIVDPEALKPITKLSSLKELRLSHCQPGPLDLGDLLSRTPVKKLLLEGAAVDNNLLSTIAGENSIEELYLVFSSVTDEGLQALKHFKSLRTLVLRTDSITEEGLENVLNLTDLVRLVVRADDISEAVFASFRYLKQLEELSLRQVDLKGEGLEYLSELVSLKRLHLGISSDATKEEFESYKDRIRLFIDNLPALEELSLRYDGPDIELGYLPRLRVLDLSNNPVQDRGLTGLAGLINLETLHLKGCNRIGSEVVAKISHLPHLKELDLSLTRINNEQAQGLSALSELRYINLASTACDNRVLESLSELSDLRYIDYPKALTDADMPHLSKLRHLRNLRLGQVSDQGLTHIESLIMVGEVNLSGQPISDDGLASIRNMSHLKDLNLSDTRITDGGMVYLSNFKELTSLNLSSTQISDDGLSALTNLVSLRSLNLENCKRLRDRGIACISSLTSLKWLNLCNTRVTDSGIASLRRLPHLSTLRLSFTQITDDGLAVLNQLHDLNVLDLENLEISGVGFKHMSACRRLKELKLSSSNIVDDAIAYLSELPALEELDLRNTQITKESLKSLAAIKSLKKLTLIGCDIAYGDLVELAPLTALETLNFHECEYTRVERAGLKMALPGCRIVLLDKDVNWT